MQIIANLAVLLYPFLPFSSQKVCSWLQIDHTWKIKDVQGGLLLPEIQILFERLDKGAVDIEVEKLKTLSVK